MHSDSVFDWNPLVEDFCTLLAVPIKLQTWRIERISLNGEGSSESVVTRTHFQTEELKQMAMDRMNRTGIQLLFDTTFIPVSLMVEWVFSSLKRKFASGDPLVTGFESRLHRHFNWEETRIAPTGVVPLKMPCDLCEELTILEFFALSLGLFKII